MKQKLVIGMVGKAGTGKDTVGDYLIENYGFEKKSLAGPLKDCVQAMFMIDDHTMYDREARELPLEDFPDWSVRKLLQFVGTELFRTHFDKDVWVKLLRKQIRESNSDRIVVTDVRFPNEQDGLADVEANLVFVKVLRKGCEGSNVGLGNHASEMYDLEGEYVLDNHTTLENLYRQVDCIMKELIKD